MTTNSFDLTLTLLDDKSIIDFVDNLILKYAKLNYKDLINKLQDFKKAIICYLLRTYYIGKV